MQRLLPLVSVLLVACHGQHPGTMLHKHNLPGEKSLCNDGTRATYYTQEGMASGSVLIGLQGGGACHDLEECTRRCEEDGVPLCSSKNARDQIQMGGRASVWSPLPEENPAFHDWFKVWVPYCSSDEHAGNRDASAETANLHFNGKNIVSDVVDQLMAHPLAGQTIEKIVIIGFSAGGAGVARNCDFMADKFAALGSTAKVMCIMDGADFEPYWMTNRCDLILDERESAEFWNAHEDDTCVSELGDTAVECSAFSTFWPYVETPFMIVSSEADPVVHFCADNPALGENTPGSFAREWREGMVELTQQVIDSDRNDVGIFLGNCAFHVGTAIPEVYTDLAVSVLGDADAKITLMEIIDNWVNNKGTSRAMDDPTIDNPTCPQH